jgi:cellulose synthase/poly-beta-1,6-N-acetylglucosamine synthase-like glycosyltransferase
MGGRTARSLCPTEPDSIMSGTEAVFWASVATVAYVFAGYPATLALLRRRPRSTRRATQPTVTVVIAAYNEVAHIGDTVRNKLAQDYPAHLLDVVVVSDGSTDGTDDVVRAIDDPRVTLLRQEPRQGKTLALNRAIDAARGDIVVFSDANSRYAVDAVRQLVDAFADETVGYVTGRLVYEASTDTGISRSPGLYMRYENWLRQLETRVGSVVGVNGGVDAVRRHLYTPMRAEHLPDFVLPLRVVQQGFRVVHVSDAVASEAALGRHEDEFRMRVRVSLRALHALVATRALLHPRYGLFAFQLFVHKVLRYLLVLPLCAAFLSNAALAMSWGGYRLLFGAQLLAVALATLGWLSGGRVRLRLVSVPFYFYLLHLAAGAALVGFCRGQRQVLWTPRKGA